ncbi:hypothetical protein VUR80DRAFT_7239 [Thermomyces stellatus]
MSKWLFQRMTGSNLVGHPPSRLLAWPGPTALLGVISIATIQQPVWRNPRQLRASPGKAAYMRRLRAEGKHTSGGSGVTGADLPSDKRQNERFVVVGLHSLSRDFPAVYWEYTRTRSTA